jgi:hypothetical protein
VVDIFRSCVSLHQIEINVFCCRNHDNICDFVFTHCHYMAEIEPPTRNVVSVLGQQPSVRQTSEAIFHPRSSFYRFPSLFCIKNSRIFAAVEAAVSGPSTVSRWTDTQVGLIHSRRSNKLAGVSESR